MFYIKLLFFIGLNVTLQLSTKNKILCCMVFMLVIWNQYVTRLWQVLFCFANHGTIFYCLLCVTFVCWNRFSEVKEVTYRWRLWHLNTTQSHDVQWLQEERNGFKKLSHSACYKLHDYTGVAWGGVFCTAYHVQCMHTTWYR